MYHTLIFNLENRSISRNLGPYRISHWLREKDWDAEVIDYALMWSFEQLTELTRKRLTKNTKFIGFSFQFGGWNDTMVKYALWLKQEYPDIVLISGSSVLHNKNDPIDYHIYGFGEYAIEKLLSYLFSNGEMPNLKQHGNTKYIDAVQYPAYPLPNYDVEYQERDFLQPWEFLSIETGRGCKFKCAFCNFTILGVKEDHSTSAESFEKQLKNNYSKWGIKNYIAAEETFNDRQEKMKKFANVVGKLPFTPWFSGFVRIDLALSRPDDRKYLEDMNLLGQFYGIESFNHQTAKTFKKGFDTNKIKDGLIELKDYFSKTGLYRGTTSFILGGPYESIDSHYQTMDWLVENWSDNNVGSYPFAIPIDDTRRASTFSSNYEKYNYKPISFEELRRKHPNENEIVNHLESTSDGKLVWQSDIMDIVECFKIYNDWNTTIGKTKFKMGSLSIGRFTGEGSTLEDKLKLDMTQMNDWKDEEHQWYYKYIDMKLNLNTQVLK